MIEVLLTPRNVAAVFLGERELRVPAQLSVFEQGATFFSSGYGAGYQVEADKSGVTIRHVSRWATLAGFPPLYYFKGTLCRSAEGVTLEGRMLMSKLVKYPILIWFGAVLIALAIGIVFAMYGFVVFVAKGTADMSAAGGFIGAVVVLAVFGAVVVGALRALKRTEREGLVRFCGRFAQGQTGTDHQ
jgi:hypothetical protein